MICEDVDGNFIVDFLGKFMRTGIKATGMAHLVDDGFNFVKRQYLEHKNAKNSKLALSYARIMDYYQERLADWDLPEEENPESGHNH